MNGPVDPVDPAELDARGYGLQLAVTFMDDAERFFPLRGVAGAYQGWSIRQDRGVALLIVGGRPPRVEIPLANVRMIHLVPFRTSEERLLDAVLGREAVRD